MNRRRDGSEAHDAAEGLRAPALAVSTTIRTAEVLEYACNASDAAKITFANEVVQLSQKFDVDPVTGSCAPTRA